MEIFSSFRMESFSYFRISMLQLPMKLKTKAQNVKIILPIFSLYTADVTLCKKSEKFNAMICHKT